MTDPPRRPDTRRPDTRRPDTRRLDELPAQPDASARPETPARPDTRPAEAGTPVDPAPGAMAAGAADPGSATPGRRAIWPKAVAAGTGLLVLSAVGSTIERAVATVTNPADWPGWLTSGGVFLVVAGLAIGCLHELRGLRDLRRLGGLNERARRVRADEVADDPALIRELKSLYAGRPELAGRLHAFRRDAEGIGDAANQLAAFEMHVLAELDVRAHAAIIRAVRRNATATALSPFALLDASVTAWTSLRMLREIATLFGARPGAAASLRLARIALGNVLAAGLFETAQDAVSDLVGGGVAGRVSSSMASAIANGLLTARLGLAALEACRPVPVAKPRRTRARTLVRRALSDSLGSRRTDRQPEGEA